MDIHLNRDLEIELVNNEIVLNDGSEAIRQHLQTTFGLFLGEWFLDETAGVPWFRDILIKKPSFVVIDAVLKDTILSVPGVISITKYEFNYDPAVRMATLNFTVLTSEGFIDFTTLVNTGGGS